MQAHRVVVLGFDKMAPFELGVVAEVFALERPELDVAWWYSFRLCAEHPGRLRALGGFSIDVAYGLGSLSHADTIIVPGTADPHRDPSVEVLSAICRAHRRGARLMSICSGAFVLAAAGVLDGRRAATHWRYADLLQARFPTVQVDSAVLYVDEGQIITSAGTAAGIDACLHLVRRDHGAEVATSVARRMVVAPHRDGGQQQFIERPVPTQGHDDPVAQAIDYASQRVVEPLTVGDLAGIAHLSPRQFTRRFVAATGESPGRWLIRKRVEASLHLLESDPRGIEAIANAVGFGTPAGYRKHFRAMLGISPTDWRRRFASKATR